jgi:hypothetical protein
MPSHKDHGFRPACKALVKQDAFKKRLRKKFGVQTDQIIRCFSAGEQLPKALDDAYDSACDFLCNEAPVVKSYDAEQAKGVFHVTICGFHGAYFVRANEYENSEVFGSLPEAEEYVMENFGEFLC